jgi:hypothetical protein
MFDYAQYVPILRWKQAEWLALRHLQEKDSIRMTPLVEPVPAKFVKSRPGKTYSVDKELGKIAEGILQNWGQDPLFMDLWLLPSKIRTESRLHPFELLGEEARLRQLSIIPTTGLNRNAAYQSAVAALVAADRRGACIRLLRDDIQRSTLPNELEHLLSFLELQPAQVDLLVDYQFIDCACAIASKLGRRLPYLTRWRTFTVASGAFPKNLTAFTVGQHEHPRLDWQVWHDLVRDEATLSRRPSYSDYTIQHPIFSEPPPVPNFSASIRYAHYNYWVIMRGEGVFHDGSPGFAQWPANALLLCERDEFCGDDFSYGDKYIKEMSLQLKNTGNARTWLQAGLNHHLTFVVRQIASLFDSSNADVP